MVDVVVKRADESCELYLKFCSEHSISEDDVLPVDPACYSYEIAKTMMSACERGQSLQMEDYCWRHEQAARIPASYKKTEETAHLGIY